MADPPVVPAELLDHLVLFREPLFQRLTLFSIENSSSFDNFEK
jgi:hypothetical protein